MTWQCRTCRYPRAPKSNQCTECQRHEAIAVLVTMLIWNERGRRLSPGELDALDAISQLLGVATRLRRAHSRELRDEQRSAQQDARASYDQGRFDGRHDGDGY